MVTQRSVVCPKNDKEKGTNGECRVGYDDMLLGIEVSSKWIPGFCSAVVVRWCWRGRQWTLQCAVRSRQRAVAMREETRYSQSRRVGEVKMEYRKGNQILPG